MVSAANGDEVIEVVSTAVDALVNVVNVQEAKATFAVIGVTPAFDGCQIQVIVLAGEIIAHEGAHTGFVPCFAPCL